MFTLNHKPRSIKSYDHLGNEYNSFKEMCEHYHLHDTVVRARLKKNMTLEQALTQKLRCEVEYKGKKYSSLKALCDMLNVKRSTVEERLRKNKDLETALTVPLRVQPVEYKGEKYHSITVFCDTMGINKGSLVYFIKKGLTVEQSADLLLKKKKPIIIGNKTFYSIQQISEHFKIGGNTVRRNLRVTDDRQALLALMEKSAKIQHRRFSIKNAKKILKTLGCCESWATRHFDVLVQCKNVTFPTTDHLGNKFPTVSKMCQYHNASTIDVIKRYLATGDIKKSLYKYSYVDINGEEHYFQAINDVAMSMGLGVNYLKADTDVQKIYDRLYRNHFVFDNKTFNSVVEFAQHYNIQPNIMFQCFLLHEDDAELQKSLNRLFKTYSIK